MIVQRLFAALLFLVTLTNFSFGQTKSFSDNAKFYRTYQDYLLNKSLNITDTQIKIQKDSTFHLDNFIWGIIDSNLLFRVYKNNIYRVEDTSGLAIYSIDTYKTEMNFYSWIIPEMPFIENKVKSNDYFFSKKLNTEIFDLTINSLEKEVNEPLFIKKAKRKFRWYNYDIFERYKSGQFMVNRLYNKYYKSD